MFRLAFVIFCLNSSNACTQSGWSSWINDRLASQAPLPGEENATELKNPGGDFENMNTTVRDHFCASGHGVITDIECVTANNGTSYAHAQSGQHAMSCEAASGFKCLNRHVDGGSCLDYKIRLFCNCTSPVLISPASAVVTSSETTLPSKTMSLPLKNNTEKSLSSLSAKRYPTTRREPVTSSNGKDISTSKSANEQGEQSAAKKNAGVVVIIWMPFTFLLALVTIVLTMNNKC
ncbi:uncharacterized protein LOC123523597 [Mercenaria mercenaria]|uniref:uncharacterized protein LOC123523597 n=1 Tax=Mercenaria mercenaria TaxID=6596 RepID=UPI001E1DFBEA|nr:uncharacterized protein LOC123523597 [Mercenaria mercenaria]